MSVGSHSPAFCPWQYRNASMLSRTLWTPGSCSVEIHHRVLGSCPEFFPQVPQKVHQPQISIAHLVFVGSSSTVRDPGPGEQCLWGLEGNHKTDDWVGRRTGVQNRYQMWMIPLNISYFLSRRKKIIIRANAERTFFSTVKQATFIFFLCNWLSRARQWNVVYSNKKQPKLNV